MSYVRAKDISRWQGAWQETGEPIVLIKIGGGDSGLYYDSRATEDWNGAVADGRAVGGYWFAGGGNPSAEAAFFLKGMAPRVENDVYALDWEIQHADPVGWCAEFMQYVHDQVGVWPLLYINLATLNAYDWSPVLKNCGLWLADWDNNPDGPAVTLHTYVMQQYNDGPVYDHDAWFGTLDQFKAYGWHSQVTPPAPAPVEPPAPALIIPPAPTPASEPVVEPLPPEPAPAPEPTPTPTVQPTPEPPQATSKGDNMNGILSTLKSWLVALWSMPVVSRAVHTFWQTFLAVFIAGATPIMPMVLGHSYGDARTATLALVGAALAAALSATKTVAVAWWESRQV